jgi:hypothetical protein
MYVYICMMHLHMHIICMHAQTHMHTSRYMCLFRVIPLLLVLQTCSMRECVRVCVCVCVCVDSHR